MSAKATAEGRHGNIESAILILGSSKKNLLKILEMFFFNAWQCLLQCLARMHQLVEHV